MSDKILCKVRKVAERIVDINQPYYSSDLLQLIPEELLEFSLTDNNLYEAEVLIDKIRFQKETELMKMLGIPAGMELPPKVAEMLNHLINYKEKTEALPPEQQQKVREIKFLFNVAATVIHQ
ncbi:MAG: hypothetical protein A2Z69_03395 [Bacteroidetes bacterium RBG_13_44_24]|nr:MAG: hypothetical protein A2Z69_03395 [Bacteroidetes bacterium RBG_13_44_24]